MERLVSQLQTDFSNPKFYRGIYTANKLSSRGQFVYAIIF